MPAQRFSMRHVRAVWRLKWGCGLSERKIAHSGGSSRPTVAEYVRRAPAAGLSWPLPEALDETTLDRLLFPARSAWPPAQPLGPDWAVGPRERKRQGVTWCLLWQEDQAATPDGFQSSGLCRAYQTGAAQLDRVMRQDQRAGETRFVDSAGQPMPVVHAPSGERHEASLFLAVLGASNSPYAKATWTQGLPDWIGAHGRVFETRGGVPEVVVPDNLQAAVHRAHRYEPEGNGTSADLAHHSGVAVMPARAARPREKATVEGGGHGVERWILARLRHHPCFARAEVHAASRILLPALPARPFKQLPGSRQRRCDALDRPALQPLPAQPYAYAEWQRARVPIDSHVEVDGH
jgi:transposase